MKSVLATAAIALLVPALALAQKTSFDFDKTADFSKFQTYTLKDGTKVGIRWSTTGLSPPSKPSLRPKG